MGEVAKSGYGGEGLIAELPPVAKHDPPGNKKHDPGRLAEKNVSQLLAGWPEAGRAGPLGNSL